MVALPNKTWWSNDCNHLRKLFAVNVLQVNELSAPYCGKEDTMLTWLPHWEVIILKLCVREREGGMRAEERVCLEHTDPRVNLESLTQLNARRITALSHSSRHTVLSIISQFLGNQHLNCKLIPKYGRSFLLEHVHPKWLGERVQTIQRVPFGA